MSSHSDTTAIPAFPPPPPGLNYLVIIKPALNFLIIGTIWSSFLIPMVIALFFFSTSHSRRKPIFVLNVFLILSGLALGIMNAWFDIMSIIGKSAEISTSTYLGYTVYLCLTPVFNDLVLLVRLFAVYPPGQLSWSRVAVIFSPPVLLKIVRIANLSVFLSRGAALLHSGLGSAAAGQVFWGVQPYFKIEWVLQLVDNAFMSSMFLYRLKSTGNNNSRVGTLSSRRGTGYSYGARLRALFWIAVTNFVFPSLFNLALLIYIFLDSDVVGGAYLYVCHVYIGIIGVLLATVWSSSTQWSSDKQRAGLHATQSTEIIEFAARPRGGPTLGTATVTVTQNVTRATDSELPPSVGPDERESQYEVVLHQTESAKGRDLEEGINTPYNVKLEES